MKQKPLRDRVLISGTGRCGTSYLTQLLTAVGESTGFDGPFDRYYSQNMAGQELIIPTDTDDEYLERYEKFNIIKDPRLCFTLNTLLSADKISVNHIYVMIRDIHSASLSRVKSDLLWGADGFGDNDDSKIIRQTAFMYEAFGSLMETIVMNDLPHTFIKFPLCTEDSRYLYDCLVEGPLLSNVSYEAFDHVHTLLTNERKPGMLDAKIRLKRYRQLGSVSKEDAYNINSEVLWDE